MNIRKINIQKHLITFFIIVCSACLLSVNLFADINAKYKLQEGDILLQHLPAQLGSVIADVSNSLYSHCGIITYQNGEPYVIEAIGPVLYTHVNEWISRGESGMFTQLRPKNISAKQIQNVIIESEKMLGRPYDIQYELDEEKIYCSELVYKAFIRGCNLEIGEKTTLGDLDWEPHEMFIRHIAHGELPLDRVMITPESLAKSPNVKLVYSSFFPLENDNELTEVTLEEPENYTTKKTRQTVPVVKPKNKKQIQYTKTLSGTWSGEYTIKGLHKAIATLTMDNNGHFSSGYIFDNGGQIKINSFSVINFTNKKSFTAELKDIRLIDTTISAKISEHGNKIIGSWKDNLGYTGIFSLGKKR